MYYYTYTFLCVCFLNIVSTCQLFSEILNKHNRVLFLMKQLTEIIFSNAQNEVLFSLLQISKEHIYRIIYSSIYYIIITIKIFS